MNDTTKRVSRFLIQGVTAAVVEYVLFVLINLVVGDQWVVVSHVISSIGGFIVSFTLNRMWVFKSTGNPKKQLVKYLILAVINVIIGSLLIKGLVSLAAIDPLIAKFITMVMIAGWNYFIFQKLIFR